MHGKLCVYYSCCIMASLKTVFVCAHAHTCAVGLKVFSQVFALANELAVEDGFESLISRLQLYQCQFCKHTAHDDHKTSFCMQTDADNILEGILKHDLKGAVCNYYSSAA